jgi:hypothetical protein
MTLASSIQFSFATYFQTPRLTVASRSSGESSPVTTIKVALQSMRLISSKAAMPRKGAMSRSGEHQVGPSTQIGERRLVKASAFLNMGNERT